LPARDRADGIADRAPVLIPVAISARHVHLTQASIERLFGPGHTLHVHHSLSQPGQFASLETLELVGPAGRLAHVRIVGPARAADQVEISRSDEHLLGIDAPLRESGDLHDTPGIRIEGPAGAVTPARGPEITESWSARIAGIPWRKSSNRHCTSCCRRN
jgi:acetate kinase